MLACSTPLSPSPCPLVDETLTRSVVPAWTSRTNTSMAPFVSPWTRFVARELKATYRPSALIAIVSALYETPLPGSNATSRALAPFAISPDELALTRTVVPAAAEPAKIMRTATVAAAIAAMR